MSGIENGSIEDSGSDFGLFKLLFEVFDGFETITEGKLNDEEYDAAVLDLVNFLEYIGEPAKLVRGEIGGWVLLFLFFFGVLAYALKREYWSDVH